MGCVALSVLAVMGAKGDWEKINAKWNFAENEGKERCDLGYY